MISSDLQKQLPLRNLYWNSATRPLRSIASLHIDLIKADVENTAPAAVDLNKAAARDGTTGLGEHRDVSQTRSQRDWGAGAKKERRHQIPGLRQTPYLKVYFLRCSDVESYKATHRKELRDWVRDNTPPSQSTASVNAQEYHDAFEWLVVHIVLPDDGRSISRASNTGSNDMRKGYWGSDAVTEKVRLEFNGTSKTAVDRVAQVQITRDPGTVPTPDRNQNSSSGWYEFIAKAKSLILSSFDLRVTQYEEDIRERDAQRNIPGWNFNTFFVLKEGLARGFESVGLVEDALTGYQELTAGLNSVIESTSSEEQQQDLFKSHTDDLSAELKRILQPGQEHGTHEMRRASAEPLNDHDHESRDRATLGSNILDTDRKPFRELILANEISIFDFRCYLFAKETLLLLRLASGSESMSKSDDSSGDRSEDVEGTSRAEKPAAKDHLLLSEICRQAVTFFASAGRLIRDDLRSSIDPLSKGNPRIGSLPFSTVADPIENIVASWSYSACQCILDNTDVPSLNSQLQDLLRNLDRPDTVYSEAQGQAGAISRNGLPQRTSSLPVRESISPRSSGPDSFPALAAMRSLPPTSSQTGLQELAAQRAEIMSLKRRILAGVGCRTSNIKVNFADLAGSTFTNGHEMEEISLQDTSLIETSDKNADSMSNAGQVNSLQNKELSRALTSEDTYLTAYEVIFIPYKDLRRLTLC